MRTACVLSFSAFVVFFACSAQAQQANRAQRVLLISVDTLRADYLGCYGQKRLRTPNIDSLAQSGTTLEHAVSTAPLTLPAHTSMLTGLYPTHHGIHDNSGFYLDQKITTLAEILQKQGFRTAAFIAGFPMDSRFGLDQGFQEYHDPLPVRLVNNDFALPELPASTVVDAALETLAKFKQERWFLFLHFYDPHHPYMPPEDYRTKYPKNFYAGEIAYVDDQLGRIFDYLKKQELMSSTLIVFTSDHGESLGAHGEKSHGVFAYESTLHVPLIFSGPGIPSNKRVKPLSRLIDVAPTILDLMNIRNPGPVDGQSLMPVWNSANPGVRQNYFESLATQLNRNWAPLRGFYSPPYKYIELPIAELYDLSTDPKEGTNLCLSNAPLCAKYRGEYQRFAEKVGAVTEVKAQEVDPEVAEKLEALGYITASQKNTAKKQYGVQDDPKNLIELDAMINESLGLHNMGQTEKAIDLMEQAIQRRNDLRVAFLQLAFLYEDSGQMEKAASTLQRGIAVHKDDARMYAKLGLYLKQLGRTEQALAHLKTAVQLDPRDLESQNYLGMIYTDTGNYALAEQAFQKALKLDSTAAVTYNNYAVLYMKQKKLQPAVENYQTAIRYDPQMSAAFNGLGAAYALMNKPQDAIGQWKKALELDPSQLDALLNIGYSYLKLNQSPQGVEALQQFLSKASPRRYSREIEEVKQTLEKVQDQTNN